MCKKKEISDATRGFLECALWLSINDSGKHLDSIFCVGDFSDDDIKKADDVVSKFLEENEELLSRFQEETERADDYIGHDLFLSTGYGTGFLDRTKGDLGLKVSKVAENYLSECSAYDYYTPDGECKVALYLE